LGLLVAAIPTQLLAQLPKTYFIRTFLTSRITVRWGMETLRTMLPWLRLLLLPLPPRPTVARFISPLVDIGLRH